MLSPNHLSAGEPVNIFESEIVSNGDDVSAGRITEIVFCGDIKSDWNDATDVHPLIHEGLVTDPMTKLN